MKLFTVVFLVTFAFFVSSTFGARKNRLEWKARNSVEDKGQTAVAQDRQDAHENIEGNEVNPYWRRKAEVWLNTFQLILLPVLFFTLGFFLLVGLYLKFGIASRFLINRGFLNTDYNGLGGYDGYGGTGGYGGPYSGSGGPLRRPFRRGAGGTEGFGGAADDGFTGSEIYLGRKTDTIKMDELTEKVLGGIEKLIQELEKGKTLTEIGKGLMSQWMSN